MASSDLYYNLEGYTVSHGVITVYLRVILLKIKLNYYTV